MTRQEFETLTHTNVTSDEYIGIESVYMALPNMSKQTFCEEWVKKNHGSLLFHVAAEANANAEARRVCSKLHHEEGYLWADEAHKMSSTNARERAIQILGFEAYIKYMLEKNYTLWEADRKQLISIL